MDYNLESDSINTLNLIRNGTYNASRPDSIVIKELIEVIRYLDGRLMIVEENFGITA